MICVFSRIILLGPENSKAYICAVRRLMIRGGMGNLNVLKDLKKKSPAMYKIDIHYQEDVGIKHHEEIFPRSIFSRVSYAHNTYLYMCDLYHAVCSYKTCQKNALYLCVQRNGICDSSYY